jgi:hypothetical protein
MSNYRPTKDPTSGAIRITTYDTSGNVAGLPSVIVANSFFLIFPYNRVTTAVGANSIVWAMQNAYTGKVIKIKRIVLLTGFSGAAAAATALSLQFARYTTTASNAAISGGSALTAVKKSSLGNATNLQNAQNSFAAALTVGGTFEADFAATGIARQFGATNVFVMDATTFTGNEVLELQPSQGLAVFARNATVIGDEFGGYIEWEEV